MPLVQSVGKSSFAGVPANTTINTGQNFDGTSLVAVMIQQFAANPATSVTVAGTACTKAVGLLVGVGQDVEIWYCDTNAGGSDAVVINWGAGGHFGFASIIEWSGSLGLDGPGIVNSSNPAASVNPAVSTAGATSQANELLVAVSASTFGGSGNTYTNPAGWVSLGTETDGSGTNSGGIAYLNDTGAAGTKTATWTQANSSTSVNAIATFKLSSAPAAPSLMGHNIFVNA